MGRSGRGADLRAAFEAAPAGQVEVYRRPPESRGGACELHLEGWSTDVSADYGDYFVAGLVGAILAAERRPQFLAAVATLATAYAFNSSFSWLTLCRARCRPPWCFSASRHGTGGHIRRHSRGSRTTAPVAETERVAPTRPERRRRRGWPHRRLARRPAGGRPIAGLGPRGLRWATRPPARSRARFLSPSRRRSRGHPGRRRQRPPGPAGWGGPRRGSRPGPARRASRRAPVRVRVVAGTGRRRPPVRP